MPDTSPNLYPSPLYVNPSRCADQITPHIDRDNLGHWPGFVKSRPYKWRIHIMNGMLCQVYYCPN